MKNGEKEIDWLMAAAAVFFTAALFIWRNCG
jgi:hypothetical protein